MNLGDRAELTAAISSSFDGGKMVSPARPPQRGANSSGIAVDCAVRLKK
jgi:hypothetical protein